MQRLIILLVISLVTPACGLFFGKFRRAPARDARADAKVDSRDAKRAAERQERDRYRKEVRPTIDAFLANARQIFTEVNLPTRYAGKRNKNGLEGFYFWSQCRYESFRGVNCGKAWSEELQGFDTAIVA